MHGGMNDFLGEFNTIDEAYKFFDETVLDTPHGNGGHILDDQAWKIVDEYGHFGIIYMEVQDLDRQVPVAEYCWASSEIAATNLIKENATLFEVPEEGVE